MIPIYLLNLDRRPDRAAYMSDQLAQLGLAFERISALDGKNVADDAFLERVTPGTKRIPMARGSQAIAVSTFQIFQKIANSDAKFGLILQDDMELSPELPLFAQSSEWIPTDADLIQLEHLGRDPTTRLMGPSRDSHCAGRKLYQMRDRHLGAGCFVVRASFCQKLLDEDPKLDMPTDQYLFNPERSNIPKRANAMVVYPALARQRRDLHESDLAAERARLHEKDNNLNRLQHYSRELKRIGIHAVGLMRGGSLRKVGYAATTQPTAN